MAETFESYQGKPVSEKEVLAIVEASRRLQGWTVHAGSVYKLEPFSVAALSPDSPIKDSGVALTEAASAAAVTAGKYYWDRSAGVLYLQASDSSNPNGRFISCVQRLFFSMSSRKLPHDLASGYAVHWLPFVQSTSDFGVRVDHVNQVGEAIEGSGSLTLANDGEYWASRYEKLYFENQRAFIYSWSPILAPSEAKLIFRGKITGRSYSESAVQLRLQDTLFELRAEIPLDTIGSVGGALVPRSLEQAKQRLIYGRVYGHRLTNIDQVDRNEGYPLTGTVSIEAGQTALTGAGTVFLEELSPDDQVVIEDLDEPVTIGSISADGTAELSEAATRSLSGKTFAVLPDLPKRYSNRNWVIAGHALREPETTVVSAFGTSLMELASSEDFEADADILVGDELVTVRRVVPGNRIRTETNLETVPTAGTVVKRLAVTNVRINAKLLVHDRDYTYSAADGTLTLDPLAEFNIAKVRILNGTVTFESGSRTVTGAGTAFTKQLTPNSWIKASLQSDWAEVLQVVSDEEVILRTPAAYTATGSGSYKAVEVFDEDEDVLSCDVLGATEEGTTSGTWIKTASQIVKDLMIKAGLEAELDLDSFSEAEELAPHKVGLVVPAKYSDTKSPTFRSIINQVNKSIFGELVQSADFTYKYRILSPGRSAADAKRFLTSDTLAWSIKSLSDKIVGTVRLEYLEREYDSTADQESVQVIEVQNDEALYLAGSANVFDLKTLIVDEEDARSLAGRWAFLLSVALSIVTIRTKMQGARLSVGDAIDFLHSKLFHRAGSESTRKIGAVTAARRSGEDSVLEFEDLANAFARVAAITEADAADWDASSEEDRVFNGFITDAYGSIDNDPDLYGLNLIW
jgi:hypothetical protein